MYHNNVSARVIIRTNPKKLHVPQGQIASMSSPRARQGNRRPSDRLESFLAQVPGVDYGVLDDLLGYALRRAQLRIYQDFFEALDAWDITPPRFSAMTLIHHNRGMKLT